MGKRDFKVHSMRDLTSELYISVLEKIILRAYIAMDNGNHSDAQALLKSFVDNSGIGTDFAQVGSKRYSVTKGNHNNWLVCDDTIKHPDYPVVGDYDTFQEALTECNRLNGSSD